MSIPTPVSAAKDIVLMDRGASTKFKIFAQRDNPKRHKLASMLRGQFIAQTKLHEALFGDIWLCRDQQGDNRFVAVKQVQLDLARRAFTSQLPLDNPWVERRTLDTLQQLGSHENVLRVYQQFQQNDAWFAVMEFCDGGDLHQTLELAPHHRLPEIQALPLFAQVVRGMQWLHSNDIAHRDLSLENVFYCRGECKIGDFGLSTDAPQRASGEAVGKAYYMAPEVVNQEAYDAFAADLWSLGIMLFIMLTGSPLTSNAARGNKAFGAFCELGVAKVIDSWGLSDRISTLTVALLDKLLSVDPDERPTVGQVLEILTGVGRATA